MSVLFLKQSVRHQSLPLVTNKSPKSFSSSIKIQTFRIWSS